MLSSLLSVVLYSYLAMQATYWSLVAIFGTPLSQPLPRVVMRTIMDTIFGKLKPMSGEAKVQYPQWKIRCCVLITQLKHLLLWRPLFGILDYADQLVLERFYCKQAITQPLYVVSAPRSGSTTMGHLLDADPSLCGPAAFFHFFPYLSVWMLLNSTIGRIVSAEKLEQKALNGMRTGSMKEFAVRHEVSMRHPDTFDVAMAKAQWMTDVWAHGMSPNECHIESRGCWGNLDNEEQKRALDFHDEIAKKWLWWCGADAKGQHLLMKSHLVDMVKPLKDRHPDAVFVTVGRDPVDMICSAVPFLSCASKSNFPQPSFVEWPFMVHSVCRTYMLYVQKEMELCKEELMLMVPFTDMIHSPASVMEKIYSHRAGVWGTAAETYQGSTHAARVEAEATDPRSLEEKQWRKSMKSQYPSMKREQLMAMLEAAAADGYTNLDLKKAFDTYKIKLTASDSVRVATTA